MHLKIHTEKHDVTYCFVCVWNSVSHSRSKEREIEIQENKALRRLFGPKKGVTREIRKIHNKELTVFNFNLLFSNCAFSSKTHMTTVTFSNVDWCPLLERMQLTYTVWAEFLNTREDGRKKTYRSCQKHNSITAWSRFLRNTGRKLLGVSFVTSVNLQLRTALPHKHYKK